MSFAATWMDLEMMMLSEVRQTETDKYHLRVDTFPPSGLSAVSDPQYILRGADTE